MAVRIKTMIRTGENFIPIYLVDKVIKEALWEDIGKGDITTEILISSKTIRQKANIIANSQGVLAGIEIAREVFRLLDPGVTFTFSRKEGQWFDSGDVILELEAYPRALLEGERVSLNFLQRLSGIATLTRKFVEKVSPYGVKILDTRKTTPNLRQLEKYAVRVGGGINHRFSLDNGILVKDNHVKIAGGIKKAVELIRENIPPFSKIEVEVSNFDELKEAIESKVDVIMLDNLSDENLKKAIQMIRDAPGKIMIEVSGGVDLDNVEKIAMLRPDFISVGKLTYSPISIDMSLEVK